jgi:hypothetical protein
MNNSRVLLTRLFFCADVIGEYQFSGIAFSQTLVASDRNPGHPGTNPGAFRRLPRWNWYFLAFEILPGRTSNSSP